MSSQGSVFKGSLLVAGTAIGGGMLALPVLTSPGGFIPSVVLFVVCWLFMAATGLLFLEVCLWMEGETNLISMAEKTLGGWGKAFAWVLYLFMFYTLTLAYVLGCSGVLMEVIGPSIAPPLWPVLFLVVFAPMVYVGAHLIGKINVPLMIALGISYLGFIYFGFNHVQKEFLLEHDWKLALKGLPIAFIAFGFQGLVPTLTRYLNRDREKVRHSILWGSFLALITYLIWQWLILGIVPRSGPASLEEALQQGFTAVQPLKFQLHNPIIFWVGQSFAFFALLTSFLGVALALRDFLSDGLQIERTTKGRLYLCSMIFVPVLIASYFYPTIFLEALGYAGGYGTALLLGLLPILMVWSGRYRMGLKGQKLIPGGRFTLSMMILFIAFEVILETMHVFG